MKEHTGTKKLTVFVLSCNFVLFCPALSGAEAAQTFTVVDHNLQASIAPLVARYFATLHKAPGTGEDRGPPIEMDDLSPENRPLCLDLVEKALAVYPDHLVDAFVRTIALADALRAWGIGVGGVQAPQIIGVTCATSHLSVVRQTVHGAIAGKVLDLTQPDWAAWAKDNPAKFVYGDPTPFREALAKPDAALADRSLNAKGFVGRIGLSDQEADFQTYAEQAFLDGPAFAATVRANPAMRNKLRLLLDCYLFVAPDLRPYFERTGLLAASEGAGR